MLLQSRIVVFSQGSPSNFVGFLLVMTLNPCKLCGVNNACRSFHQNNTQAWTSGRLCLVWVYPVLGDLIKQGHWAYHRCPNMDDAGFNELKTILTWTQYSDFWNFEVHFLGNSSRSAFRTRVSITGGSEKTQQTCCSFSEFLNLLQAER